MSKRQKSSDKYNIDDEIIIGYSTKKDKPQGKKKKQQASSNKKG